MLKFEWDRGNLGHIALHGVTLEEAEEAFNSDTLELGFDFIDDEERIDELGSTGKGRILRMVTVFRGDKVRVVTAFDAPRFLKLAYLKEKGVRYD